MILLAYGTRPEYIKIKSLIKLFNEKNFKQKTLFTGQHKYLLKDQKADYQIEIIDDTNSRLDNILMSTMKVFDWILEDITHVLVQGDTNSVFAGAVAPAV